MGSHNSMMLSLFLLEFFLAFDRKGGINVEFKVVFLNFDVKGVDSKNIMDFTRNLELADVLWFSRIDPCDYHLARVVEEVPEMLILTLLLELDVQS